MTPLFSDDGFAKGVWAKRPLRDLAGGHHESRTGAEDCVGVGGIALFSWRLPADDVSMATELSQSFGIRGDDA